MEAKLETAHRDETCSIHVWRSLLVLVWHRAPTEASLVAPAAAMNNVTRNASHSFVLCAIAPASITGIEAGAREAVQKALARMADKLVAAVNVIQAQGFAAAALRGMLTGFSLIVRPKYPTAFVGTIAEAASFVGKHWPASDAPVPSAGDLQEALTSVAPH